MAIAIVAALLALVGGAGATIYIFRAKIFKPAVQQAKVGTNQTVKHKAVAASRVVHPIPTNISWTMDLTNAVMPEAIAAGSIHGSGFVCEKAILQGVAARDSKTPPRCDLTLRQGKSGSPDLGVTIQLFAQQGEELGGQTVVIAPDRPSPVPNVVLRWKDDEDKAVNRNITDGYALKVIFGEPGDKHVPGKIYLSLPDENKSFVAGTFDAEIRKAPPPKPKQPKAPKPSKPTG